MWVVPECRQRPAPLTTPNVAPPLRASARRPGVDPLLDHGKIRGGDAAIAARWAIAGICWHLAALDQPDDLAGFTPGRIERGLDVGVGELRQTTVGVAAGAVGHED